jgi:hypothetical protein
MMSRSFDLFRKGVLTLQQHGPQKAVSVDFANLLKLQSSYPALGFFGFALVILCIGFVALPPLSHVLNVKAKITPHDPNISQISLSEPLGDITIDSTGDLQASVSPKFITVRIITPGYKEPSKQFTKDASAAWGSTIDFGTLSLGEKSSVERQDPDPKSLVKPDKPLPPYSPDSATVAGGPTS